VTIFPKNEVEDNLLDRMRKTIGDTKLVPKAQHITEQETEVEEMSNAIGQMFTVSLTEYNYPLRDWPHARSVCTSYATRVKQIKKIKKKPSRFPPYQKKIAPLCPQERKHYKFMKLLVKAMDEIDLLTQRIMATRNSMGAEEHMERFAEENKYLAETASNPTKRGHLYKKFNRVKKAFEAKQTRAEQDRQDDKYYAEQGGAGHGGGRRFQRTNQIVDYEVKEDEVKEEFDDSTAMDYEQYEADGDATDVYEEGEGAADVHDG